MILSYCFPFIGLMNSLNVLLFLFHFLGFFPRLQYLYFKCLSFVLTGVRCLCESGWSRVSVCLSLSTLPVFKSSSHPLYCGFTHWNGTPCKPLHTSVKTKVSTPTATVDTHLWCLRRVVGCHVFCRVPRVLRGVVSRQIRFGSRHGLFLRLCVPPSV